ncbi:arsenical pump-driving ATPase [Bifidobacterium cuniculi]|uniref:Arsenical pump-driving ATPase n=1 Tax=Bifidobacterium cuniculi TaxID=1688 RepID=A0A087B4K7_9BIFI|nr:arsenical pump-driving ATPase [Bifidobacterium cuniculi]KFI65957.1 arsenical pump-driving ATPase [Bifidobacterium cuniculi]
MLLNEWPPHTPFLMFTGKGGVGKTTVSCATAISLARSGKRVLLVSTDPASNVAQVFGRPIGSAITPLGDLIASDTESVLLDAIEIDPQAEAEAYRESVLAPVRGLLPADVLAEAAETLSGSCTVEVAAFNRFVDFLADPDYRQRYDHIVFDTAPTGHTLRLLALPGDWSSFIQRGAGDASCLGPLSGLDKKRSDYEQAVRILADPDQTTLTLVTRSSHSTLAEADRSANELSRLGVKATALVVNGLLPDTGQDSLLKRMHDREQAMLAGMADEFPSLRGLPVMGIEMCASPVMGARELGAIQPQPLRTPPHVEGPRAGASLLDRDITLAASARLQTLVDDIASNKPRIVLAMGKGGVGKTTVAQAIAVSLARRGLPVLLATTDPASHLNASLADEYDTLEIRSIDPVRVVEDYRQEVLEHTGKGLDPVALAQLKEDLASPCTEEVAVFRAFSEVLEKSDRKWVVVDTAPTGHTLLLLDATSSYHRELMRQSGYREDGNGQLTALNRLRDHELTVPLLVTLPESTPILEARELADDLARAGITPYGWVVNQYLEDDQLDSTFLEQRAVSQRDTLEHLLTPYLAGTPCWSIGMA